MIKRVVLYLAFGLLSVFCASAVETSSVTVSQIALSEAYPQYTRISLTGNNLDLGCEINHADLLDRNSVLYDEFLSVVLTAKTVQTPIVLITTWACANFNGKQVAVVKTLYMN